MSIQSEIKCNPVDHFKIDFPFGWREHPISRAKDFHNGIDIKLPLGSKCYAVASGKVLISQFHASLGWYIVIVHKGFLTLYAHLKLRGAPVGKKVEPGEIVGYVGSTGSSTGAHLHLEIREGEYKSNSYFWDRGKNKNGKYPNSIDPALILPNEPLYIRTIRETQNSPESWIKFIEEMNNHPTGKYLPQFIENITRIYVKRS